MVKLHEKKAPLAAPPDRVNGSKTNLERMVPRKKYRLNEEIIMETQTCLERSI